MLTEYALPEKKAPLIADFKENHTDTTVHFTIMLTPEQAQELNGKDLYKFFKLESYVKTTNFNLFDQNGHIQHYDSAEAILDSFFEFRYPLYQVRKEHLIKKLEKETTKLSNMARFILAVISGELVLSNRPRKDIMKDLVRMKFDMYYPEKVKTSSTTADVVVDREENEEGMEGNYDDETKDLSRGYDYLLSMKLWKLTKELVDELLQQVEKGKQKLEELRNTSTKTMWENDLDAFVEELLEVSK